MVAGLERYGYHDEAMRLRNRWCDLCTRIFTATGAMWEKYNVVQTEVHPESGLYGSIPGFGLTNAVFVYFARHEAAAAESQSQ